MSSFPSLSSKIHLISARRDLNANGANLQSYFTSNRKENISELQNSAGKDGSTIWTPLNPKANGRFKKTTSWFVTYMKKRKDGPKYQNYFKTRETSIRLKIGSSLWSQRNKSFTRINWKKLNWLSASIKGIIFDNLGIKVILANLQTLILMKLRNLIVRQ